MSRSRPSARLLTALFVALCPFRVAAERLNIGSIGADLKGEAHQLEPLAGYLTSRLKAVGVESVGVEVRSKPDDMRDAIAKGDVQIVVESPYEAAIMAQETGAVPILRRWKKGLAEYWSEILVRTDGQLADLQALRGRVIALEDPGSTSGDYLPRVMLATAGLGVQVLPGLDARPEPDRVGVVFSNDHRTSVLWLLASRVDGVALDTTFAEKLRKEEPDRTRSLARSITVPRHVVLVAPSVSSRVKNEVESLLLAMSDSEEGRDILRQSSTDRFDHFPLGVDETFKPIYESLKVLALPSAQSGRK